MTPLEIRIACLWRHEKLNTDQIAKIVGMQEHEIDRMRPSHLAKILWATEYVERARV